MAKRRVRNRPFVAAQAATAAPAAPPSRATPVAPITAVPGRLSEPTNANPYVNIPFNFTPRRQYTNIELSREALRLSPQQYLDLASDISPEVSLATWNIVRMGASKSDFQVRSLDGTRELKRAKGTVDSFLERVNPQNGGMKSLIQGWFNTAFLQGAVAGEAVMADDASEVVDIVSVQPWTIYFQRDEKQQPVPYQQIQMPFGPQALGTRAAGGYKRLNPVTFGYNGIDCPPDDLYGRAPAGPSLQLLSFDMQVLKDVRQAVHTSSWGRLHIKLLEEIILKNAPEDIKGDVSGEKRIQFVNSYLSAFRDAYSRIKPDDAFVTTDAVGMAAIDFSGSTFKIDVVLRMLERRLFRALKQLPVLMGSNEGTTETHGTVQLQIYVAAIASLQESVAWLIQKLLSVYLRSIGIAGKVVWTFEAPNADTILSNIQAEQALTNLVIQQRDQGFIDQEEASIRATGSAPVNDGPGSNNNEGNDIHPGSSGNSSDQSSGGRPNDSGNTSARRRVSFRPRPSADPKGYGTSTGPRKLVRI